MYTIFITYTWLMLCYSHSFYSHTMHHSSSSSSSSSSSWATSSSCSSINIDITTYTRVSFPKPPVPVVRWNLTGGDCTCMAIPSSGVAARTRGWRWRPPGPSRRKRHCVSTAPGRWPCWGSASYQQHSCRKVQSVPPEDGDPE